MPQKDVGKYSPFSVNALIVGFVLGGAALVTVLAGLHIPIPGTGVVTDPRELFTTYGAALSGPIGAAIVGILAGIAEPGEIPLASILAHTVGCMWMAYAYKEITCKREGLSMFAAWFLSVLAYYFVFVVPGFAVGLVYFYGEPTPIQQFYNALAVGAIPEAMLTSIITTLVLFVMPKQYRKPLW
jgi:hypothetical protein